MNYEDVKRHLYSDGSLRDIYVFAASHSDLNRFLDFVKPLLKEDSYTEDGKVANIPKSYEEALERRKDRTCLLGIPVGRSTVNCHFFDDTEIELDLVPSHYDTEEEWIQIDSFLSDLAEILGKEVVMTGENEPNEILVRYKPRAEQVGPIR